MASSKKSTQSKAAQKKQAKKIPPAAKTAQTIQKTPAKTPKKPPRGSKGSRVALINLLEHGKDKVFHQEQSVWMKGVLDTAMDAIITMDEQQQIVLFNKGAEAMFRCSSTEAIGKSIDQFIPHRFRTIHHEHVQRFMQSGESVRAMKTLGELFALRADGKEFPIEASISKFDIFRKIRLTVILRDITERKQAQDSLKKEQQFIAAILDTADALVVVLDPQWRIVRFNRACENLTGRTIGEMRGKFFLNLSVASGEDALEVKNLLASFKKGGGFPKSFESAWVGVDHQLRWVAWSNTVLADKEGKMENIIATGIDITVRKQDEQEIQRLSRQNALILHSAGEGIYGIDVDGKATFFNYAAEQLTGWTWLEVQGQVLHPLLHHTKPDGTPYLWDEGPVYSSVKKGRNHQLDSETLCRKDGTSFPAAFTSSPIRNAKKKIEGAVVTFQDITVPKKAEEALRESEERFQVFMNHSPTVAFLKNEKGEYVYVNQQWEEKFHLSRADCLGKTDQQLFPPEVARMFKEHDREALKTREVLETEETTLDEKGRVRYWWVMKFPVYGKEGEVLLGGVALDITVRKKAEEALQQRELDLQESQAVLQSLGGQLISAQEDERRRISRELHDDMNQRLAILALNIQSAQKGLSESVSMYQTLQNLYDGVSTLSDDVRHLAYQLHPSILDDLGLKVALRSFIEDFSKWEGIPVAFVSADIPISLPQALTSCLYRVTQECLRNVARYAHATQVDVKLIEEDGGLRLCVKDNGKGFKVEEKRTGQHGLGLIGMQERVRVVQGTCEVKSILGQGTQIGVWVPTTEVKSEKLKVKRET